MLSASDAGAPVAMATMAAGGAVLWVCETDAALRTSGLDGLSDFQVTTLSEALRILKNEIRKGLPVSVAVLDARSTVWAEAAVRGVQPDVVLPSDRDALAVRVFVERGAQSLRVPIATRIAEHRATTWRDRKDADAALLAGARTLPDLQRIPAEQWFIAAPRLFPRDRTRCYMPEWQASKEDR